MEMLQTRWSLDDAAHLVEAIEIAQEASEDQEWNRDVQVLKTRLLSGIARADQRAARNASA